MNKDLIQLGKFSLHSGETSDFKIDCDALNIRELRAIAYLLSKRLPPFKLAVGVPTGGTKIAGCMEKYYSKSPDARILIVDDVYTTGASMNQLRAEIPEAMGAVIFARNNPPEWITPLFVMSPGYEPSYVTV